VRGSGKEEACSRIACPVRFESDSRLVGILVAESRSDLTVMAMAIVEGN
jgi:hypothetical protein